MKALLIKDIPKEVLKQIKYVPEEGGYKIIYKDGSLSPETYLKKVGAAAMIMGIWDLL